MNKKLLTTLLSGIILTSTLVVGGANKVVVSAANTNNNIVDTYYKDVDLSLTGQNFIDHLTPIINANYNKHSYSYNNTVLAETDADPNHKGNIICFYTGQSLSSGWNKEHVWAKSHGFPQTSKQAYCDAHHLRPTLVQINSTRGNKDFGEVPNGSTDGFGNRWNSTTFEPRDEVKGDVARMMFYMVTKYNHIDGVHLELTNNVPTSRNDNGEGRFGHYDTLLKWHYQDPVSDFERNRNNVVYSYQKNRNPYIDHPEYVDIAFPNNIDNVEIDQAKVDNVISKINALNDIVTLNDKAQINEANALYQALNSKEKALVTNYSKLTKALSDLHKLENPDQGQGETEKPVDPVTGDTITFDTVADSGYVTNQTLTIGDKKLLVNAMYKAGAKDFRLGYNKPIRLDTKYGQSSIVGDVAVVESLYDIKNLNTINYKSTDQHGTVTNVHLLVKESNSSTYNLVETKPYSNDLTFNLTESITGSFVLIFEGTKPRVVLESITTASATTTPDKPVNPSVNPLDNVNVKESVKFTINNDKLINAGYRLGGIFDQSLFAGATDFGVIAVDLKGENKTISSFGSTMEELKPNISGYRHNIISCFNTKAIIDNNYQFAYVITNPLEITKLDITYAIYVVKDGKVYLSNENTSNFYKALELTKNSSEITENDKVLINKALEILK